MVTDGRGWHGESHRHSQAARGIKTVASKKGDKYVSRKIVRKRALERRYDRRAKQWAYDILDETESDETDEETTIIGRREYLLTYEGWERMCFLDVGLYNADKDACRKYAAEKSKKILEKEWPRRWNARGYRMIEGEYSPYTFDFGQIWALWVRE